jgi:[pyruvate, water dikinase]-phosphate phosphotransferase / [pyruvate, water dikinase] kinase
VFDLIAPSVEARWGRRATPSGGRTHGMANNYESRMDAVNFSLALDDGLQPQRLDQADLILVGVSRVGKTPTALYLALQYGCASPTTRSPRTTSNTTACPTCCSPTCRACAP